MNNITLIGIDLAKKYSHIVFQNHVGTIIGKKKVVTMELLKEVELLGKGFKIAMEACGGSNHWGREFEKAGYEVAILPPQYVKAYRLKQKNDYNDAQAACEASKRQDINPVPVKGLDRQAAQHIIRVRQRLMRDQTALANHLHGTLTEYGYHSPKTHAKLTKYIIEEILPLVDLEREAKELIQADLEELRDKAHRIKELTKKITKICRKDPELKLMQSVPGVGPIVALSIYGGIEDLKRFKNGRQFAAFLGLVPRQFSTGGVTKLGGIPKKGKFPIRVALVHGARSVMTYTKKRTDYLSLWVNKLVEKKHKNLVNIALANKLARILWSVVTSKKEYDSDFQKHTQEPITA